MEVSPYIDWNLLLKQGRQGEIPAIESLRENQRVEKIAKSWIAYWAKKLPDSVVFQVLNRSSFQEILEIWADQAGKDLHFQSPTQKEIEISRPYKTTKLIQRQHHQLICTEDSLYRRFEHVRRICSPQDKILVVGDDDQLSLLLHQKGYQQVTMIDIDPKIVARIQNATQGSVRCRVHDLAQNPLPELLDDYKLMVMDPPYSLDGIKLFVDGALRFRQNGSTPHLQIYCASVCLGPRGIMELQDYLKTKNFRLHKFEPGTCRYPYSPVVRGGFIALYAMASLRLGVFRNHFRSELIPKTIASDLWDFGE